MDRRRFIGTVAGALVAIPPPAGAQRAQKMYRVAIVGGAPGPRWEVFRQALQERGWIEKQNIDLVWRWSEGAPDRMSDLATEVVRLKVDVIVTEGTVETRAVKDATGAIPIVMATTADPVATGLIASLSHPGGNVTGSATRAPQLAAKQVELLNEAVPGFRRLAVLWNTANPTHSLTLKEVEVAAAALRIKVQPVSAHGAKELEDAFSTIAAQDPQALITLADVIFDARQREIAAFTVKNRLPAVFNKPLFAEAGGLMSYGARYEEFFRRAAIYVDKILRGAKPADLPVEQPTNFELVINLKTAKALGITIPQSLLLRADEVIQ